MARRGDTKPLCHVAHASVALLRVSIAHISRDKALVLCQHRSQGTPRACSSRRSRGDSLYLGRAVTTGPHTRGRSLSWGVWTCAVQLRHDNPASQERLPHCGTACRGVRHACPRFTYLHRITLASARDDHAPACICRAWEAHVPTRGTLQHRAPWPGAW